MPDATRETRESAADGAQAATDLLAIFAHELRTPLTSLRVALQVIERGTSPEEQAELVAASRRSVERLILRLGHAIEATALTLGKLRLVLASVDAGSLIERAAAEARTRLDRADIQAQPVTDGPLRLHADVNRTLQVLAELLDNAGRAAPAGSGITIACRRDGARAAISVRDGGPGIPAAARRDVFRPLFQVDRSLTRSDSGMGLGLAVCRGLVEAQGGTIQVDDGQQSSVTFTVPLAENAGGAIEMDIDPAATPTSRRD